MTLIVVKVLVALGRGTLTVISLKIKGIEIQYLDTVIKVMVEIMIVFIIRLIVMR